MRGKRFDSGAARSLVVAGALVCAPLSVFAQTPGGPVPVKFRFVSPRNSCLQLSSMPSLLVGSPEGMVILRMQHDLSNVSAAMALRPDSLDDRTDMRRISKLRSGVDSLVREYMVSIDTLSRGGRDGIKRVTVSGQLDSNHMFVRGTSGRANFDAMRMSGREIPRDQIEMRIRALEPQVRELARGQDRMTVEMVLSRTAHAPGYLGVTSSSEALTSTINGVETVGYCDYPMVESVEPGSPADKAGILTGDTLIAYNGRDLRQFDVNYAQLLIPGRTVAVRLRRAGKERELQLVVARRVPDDNARAEQIPCDNEETREACEARMTASIRGFLVPLARGRSGMGEKGGRSGGKPPGAAGGERHPHSIPGVPMVISTTTAGGNADFAGAQITAVSRAFAANLGVEQGLLVLAVKPLSPAAESGLHEGDVISEVNGVETRDVIAFGKALASKSSANAATLQVSGKSSPVRATQGSNQSGLRTLVVRW